MLRSDHSSSILRNLEKHGLAPDAAAAVMAHLNPFNDGQYNCTGFPDTEARNTLIYTVTEKMRIDASNVETDTADAVIWTPRLQARTSSIDGTSSGTISNLNAMSAVTPTGKYATAFTGVVAHVVNAGAQVLPQANSTPGTFQWATVQHVSCESFLTDGPCRIIGFGVEVRDNTAPVDKQGSIVCCRTPSHDEGIEFVRNSTAFEPHTSDRFPPFNVAQALITKGATNWELEHGCYMPVFNTNMDCPLRSNVAANHFVRTSNPGATGYFMSPNVANTEIESTWIGQHDLNAIYLSGFKATASIDVIVRWIIEVAPDQTSTDHIKLSSLTQPSCRYSPEALELLAICAKDLPVAVYVSENETGGWFKSIMKVVRDWAPTIGNVVGSVVPGASIIGQGLGTAAKLITDNSKEIKRRKRAKKALKAPGNVPPQPTQVQKPKP